MVTSVTLIYRKLIHSLELFSAGSNYALSILQFQTTAAVFVKSEINELKKKKRKKRKTYLDMLGTPSRLRIKFNVRLIEVAN